MGRLGDLLYEKTKMAVTAEDIVMLAMPTAIKILLNR